MQKAISTITVHGLTREDYLDLKKMLREHHVEPLPDDSSKGKTDKHHDFKTILEIIFEVTQVGLSAYAIWARNRAKKTNKKNGQKITIEGKGIRLTIEPGDIENGKAESVGDFRDILDNLKDLLKEI
jgi:hypothetical protein